MLKNIIATREAEQGFYPTPPEVAAELLSDINWWKVNPQNVLEPSAGKGNLIEAIGVSAIPQYHRNRRMIQVDAIEIDPYLQQIISYEFAEDRKIELGKKCRKIENNRTWNQKAGRYVYQEPSEEKSYEDLKRAHMSREILDVSVVHDDFLTYDSRKRYGMILMNPPFSDGARHLLRAIELQERDGGLIRCVLNAETILNPYSRQRRQLTDKLEELNADIKFLNGAFRESERQTDVSVAIIKIDIPQPERDSRIFERMKRAEKIKDLETNDASELTVTDFISQIVSLFNMESDAGIALIQEFKAMRKYMLNNETCLSLCVGETSRMSQGQSGDVNEYLTHTRLKYWETLFRAPEFTGRLTSALQNKYQSMVEDMKDYDFTEHNIQRLYAQMNVEVKTGIESAIMELFEKLTAHYSWLPEMDKHRLHFNTWKHNKVEKVSNWVIVPKSGFSSEYIRDNLYGGPSGFLGDIERVLNYLDGRMTECVDTAAILKQAEASGQTRKIPLKYFTVDIFKKGTIHIKFTDKELLDRFNIYCAQKRGWLPPSYGSKPYENMDADEKFVVDSFHGDGKEGSGAVAYSKVLTESSFYLSEVTSHVQMLVSAT